VFHDDLYVFGIIHKNDTPVFKVIGSGTIGEVALWINVLRGMTEHFQSLGDDAGYFVLPEAEFKKLPQTGRLSDL
jgi:hypothetical protein